MRKGEGEDGRRRGLEKVRMGGGEEGRIGGGEEGEGEDGRG